MLRGSTAGRRLIHFPPSVWNMYVLASFGMRRLSYQQPGRDFFLLTSLSPFLFAAGPQLCSDPFVLPFHFGTGLISFTPYKSSANSLRLTLFLLVTELFCLRCPWSLHGRDGSKPHLCHCHPLLAVFIPDSMLLLGVGRWSVLRRYPPPSPLAADQLFFGPYISRPTFFFPRSVAIFFFSPPLKRSLRSPFPPVRFAPFPQIAHSSTCTRSSSHKWNAYLLDDDNCPRRNKFRYAFQTVPCPWTSPTF